MNYLFLISLVLLAHVFPSQVFNGQIVEELVEGPCQGFLWSLQFNLSEPSRQSQEYYALYWPSEVIGAPNYTLEPLDPQSSSKCISRGGKQKLKSRVLILKSGLQMGKISLFRYEMVSECERVSLVGAHS
jgi:hypothetical protein